MEKCRICKNELSNYEIMRYYDLCAYCYEERKDNKEEWDEYDGIEHYEKE